MAVSTNSIKGKNNNNTSGAAAAPKTPLPKWMPKKPLAKQVLASPCSGEWPILSKKATVQVTNAFVKCVAAKTDAKSLKPPWKELRKVKSKERPEVMEKYRSETLSKMPPEQRDALVGAIAKEKDQLLHVFLGYNQIMRELQKGGVAALLVNKSATPELLPMSFIPVCEAKGVPVVALENLDTLWRKCIAIGFKESVKSPECCFHAFYEKMVQVTKKAARKDAKVTDPEDKSEDNEVTDDVSDDPVIRSPEVTKHDLLILEEKKLPLSSITLNKSSSKDSSSRRQRPPPPVIDLSRYHLTRTRTDQRSFIPGVGLNKMAAMEEQELIMVATDVAGVGEETTTDRFDYRTSKKKGTGYQGKKPYRCHGTEVPTTATLGEADSSAAQRDVAGDDMESYSGPVVPQLEKKSSELLFQLDFDGDEGVPQTDADASSTQVSKVTLPQSEDTKKNTLKRKRSKLEKGSSYVPASVMRLVANAKRRKE